MTSLLTGIHHVTAFAKDPRVNVEFYTMVLGYRLVKKTVNYDEPTTYHMYYGDRDGTPGTLLTHFPNPHANAGSPGSTGIRETVLRTAPGSLGLWQDRLREASVEALRVVRSDRELLVFTDPDGMRLAMVEDETGVERGIDGIVAHVRGLRDAIAFLRTTLGFREVAREGDRRAWLAVGEGASGNRVELVESEGEMPTRFGAGTVHHVAWRVPDEATQSEVAARVASARVGVTPVKDRTYFKSIYFRIPGGVVFEVATEGPGFTVDEPGDALGERLCLPERFEGRREEIARALGEVGRSAVR